VDKRSVIWVFAGIVALGVVYGAMSVVMGTPAQDGPVYDMGTATDGGVAVVSVPAGTETSAGASAGGPVGSGVATGSAGATASAGSTSTEDSEDGPPAPDQPARVGEPLKGLANMPPGTVAMLEPTAATAGSPYDVTFAPFGTGLQDASQVELVIKVLSSKPRDSGAKSFAFSNTNVLAVVSGGSADKVQKGGVYKATLIMVDRSGLLVPELSDIAAVTVRK
jgi:hypothetical protein